MIINELINKSLTETARKIDVQVMVGQLSPTITNHTISNNDDLKDFTLSRECQNSKFFGNVVSQKIVMKILNKQGQYNDIEKGDWVTVSMGNFQLAEFVQPFAPFQISEIEIDENTNDLKITGYDLFDEYKRTTIGNQFNFSETKPITFLKNGIAPIELVERDLDKELAAVTFSNGMNFDNNDTIYGVIAQIAEFLNCNAFINSKNQLVLRGINSGIADKMVISKDNYFTLKTNGERVLTSINKATSLGDNITIEMNPPKEGDTQTLKDNSLLENSSTVHDFLKIMIEKHGGTQYSELDIEWRGNYLAEIGDLIETYDKNDLIISTRFLNDTLTYAGGLREKTFWKYDIQPEIPSNPANLGEALNQTTARVDKANQDIKLVVSSSDANGSRITTLEQNQDSITQTIINTEKLVKEKADEQDDKIENLEKSVSTKLDAEGLELKIKEEVQKDGVVNQVNTGTGFVFNKEGLHIKKDGSKLGTTIDNDGMKVSNDNQVVLTANNQGVDALNLHATTYLIIGVNSRFEDYDNGTGCFFVGN